MEHLFQLKKDGKTVGYLKIDPKSRFGILWQKLNDVWVSTIDCPDLYFKFDSAHLFVCKDKFGKDVFADNWLRLTFPNGQKVAGKVVWDFLSWQIEGGVMLTNFKQDEIELIEDKDND